VGRETHEILEKNVFIRDERADGSTILIKSEESCKPCRPGKGLYLLGLEGKGKMTSIPTEKTTCSPHGQGSAIKSARKDPDIRGKTDLRGTEAKKKKNVLSVAKEILSSIIWKETPFTWGRGRE